MSRVRIAPAGVFAFRSDKVASDKSISHRSAMFATLAEGTSVIRNFLRGEDTMNTLRIVEALGAEVKDDGEVITIASGGIKEPDDVLDCGNSGTGMRLFCGLLASAEGHFVLTGDAYLRRRHALEDPEVKTYEDKDFYLTSDDNASEKDASAENRNPRH